MSFRLGEYRGRLSVTTTSSAGTHTRSRDTRHSGLVSKTQLVESIPPSVIVGPLPFIRGTGLGTHEEPFSEGNRIKTTSYRIRGTGPGGNFLSFPWALVIVR